LKKKILQEINLENFTSTAFKFYSPKISKIEKKFCKEINPENFTSLKLISSTVYILSASCKLKFCKEINLENFTSTALIYAP
jgi:hypothetical protein